MVVSHAVGSNLRLTNLRAVEEEECQEPKQNQEATAADRQACRAAACRTLHNLSLICSTPCTHELHGGFLLVGALPLALVDPVVGVLDGGFINFQASLVAAKAATSTTSPTSRAPGRTARHSATQHGKGKTKTRDGRPSDKNPASRNPGATTQLFNQTRVFFAFRKSFSACFVNIHLFTRSCTHITPMLSLSLSLSLSRSASPRPRLRWCFVRAVDLNPEPLKVLLECEQGPCLTRCWIASGGSAQMSRTTPILFLLVAVQLERVQVRHIGPVHSSIDSASPTNPTSSVGAKLRN